MRLGSGICYNDTINERVGGKTVEANKRRECILEDLIEHNSPLRGSELAGKYGVSRQVIVQDVALLRATGKNIVSTADGYRIYTAAEDTLKKVYCVKHDDASLEEELFIFVDNGGHLLNIIVDHKIYGEIVVDLHLKSRRQVKAFMDKVRSNEFVPLMRLTGGFHYHTVEAESMEILEEIEEELRAKGFLIE